MEFQALYNWKVWERQKQELLKFCMDDKWEKVVGMYNTYPMLQYAQLTASEETALHMAVWKSTAETVKSIVESIEDLWKRFGTPRALGLPNDQGNTPLHFAAMIGNVGMCKCIAEKNEELLGVRNNAGETPLFLAAYHGKKEAFLYLFRLCDPQRHSEYSRRGKDGQTILHVAIVGEYFDLAYQIICEYDHLVNTVDENGYTPLHVLATKPAAFRSSCPDGFLKSTIYKCLPVKKLEEESHLRYDFQQDDHTDTKKYYPENYKTCIKIFQPSLKMLYSMIKRRGKLSNNIEAQERDGPFLPNYQTSIMVIKYIRRAMLIVLGLAGLIDIERLQRKKEKNIWSNQIMDLMLSKLSLHYYGGSYGGCDPKLNHDFPDFTTMVEREAQMIWSIKRRGDFRRRETPMLLAAKNGITEIVERILELFPMAVLDTDSAGKNIVLLAVENRQIQLYELLLKRMPSVGSAFHATDTNGNSVLHVAANLGNYQAYYPFSGLGMQWEIKWYKYVKHSVPRNFFRSQNNENKTAKEVFRETHEILIKEGGNWLIITSNSCSVVATVVATVAFGTTANIPGGIKEGSSIPNLERHPGFIIFAISSLIALTFSVTSVIAFLSILTPRHGRKDFEKHLPEKLFYALTYLYTSLAAMLVCFYAGHFLMMKDDLKHNAFWVYGIVCLPALGYFTRRQLPFYIQLLHDTFSKVPRHKPRS